MKQRLIELIDNISVEHQESFLKGTWTQPFITLLADKLIEAGVVLPKFKEMQWVFYFNIEANRIERNFIAEISLNNGKPIYRLNHYDLWYLEEQLALTKAELEVSNG